MATVSRILLAHRVLLALGVIAWLIGVGGYLCTRAFISDALVPRAVMSPRTFTQVTLISVGWWLSVVVLALALVLLQFHDAFAHRRFQQYWSVLCTSCHWDSSLFSAVTSTVRHNAP